MSANQRSGLPFEKTIPRFWRDYASTLFTLLGTLGVALFMDVQDRLTVVSGKVRDLHRLQSQMIHRDEMFRRSEALRKENTQTTAACHRSRDLWRDSVGTLEEQMDQVETENARLLKALEKTIGDLRIRIAILEQHPSPAAAPTTYDTLPLKAEERHGR